MLTQDAISDLRVMRERAEFIKSNLVSSRQEELSSDEVVVRDLKRLIEDTHWFSLHYELDIYVEWLESKFFRKSVYKKSDLLYRTDKVIAITDLILGKREKKNPISRKGGNNMKSLQRRDEGFPVQGDSGFISEAIQRHLSNEPKREFNFLSKRVSNTFINMKVYNNCTFYLGNGGEEED
jgi:hypothetical protein